MTPAAAEASASPQVLLGRLRAATADATKAQRAHRLLNVAGYAQLSAIATAFTRSLGEPGVQASTACAAGARKAGAASAAGRRARRAHSAAQRRSAVAAMSRALGSARVQLAACRVSVGSRPTGGHAGSGNGSVTGSGGNSSSGSTSAAAAPHIGGTVLGSQGQPLAALPIQVIVQTSPRGELYGHSDFQAVTGPDGSFSIAQNPSAIGAVAFRAEAAFPWRGGTWTRDLLTVQGSDPAHLVFRANMSHTVSPFDGSWTTPGPEVRVTDFNGCIAFGNDPHYPVSDPNTQSVILTFQPDGQLLDGTTSRPLNWTITEKTSLCGQGATAELPAGAWTVSGITDTGRRLAFATSGSHSYTTQLALFETPTSASSPTALLDIAFVSF